MKVLINAYLSAENVHQVTTQSMSPVPIMEDRVTLDDKYGSRLQIEVGVIHKALGALASSRKMTVLEYLCKLTGEKTNV